MSPPLATDAPAQKIKGGRWTVFKFFLISTAYTSAWMAVSSQLDYFRELYGPQILLQLNIAYYLPTIPLLLVSARFDEVLDRKLGVAKTILIRLSVGLAGYGILCAGFPFFALDIHQLLVVVVGLGLFSGLAFSASYQLVSRFANKNVIALGLGCSAAGPMVMLLEVILQSGAHATPLQQRLLYGTVTAIVLAGGAASASLLFRHWDALEASRHWAGRNSNGTTPAATAARDQTPQMLAQPWVAASDARPESGDHEGLAGAPALLSHRISEDLSGFLGSASLPGTLAAYGSVEPFSTFLTMEAEEDGSEAGTPPPASPRAPLLGKPALSGGWGAADTVLETDAEIGEDLPPAGGSPLAPAHVMRANSAVWPPTQDAGSVTLRVLWAIRLPITSLFLSCIIALAVFPFFTYVPDSGLVGDAFPRILFFGRVFADIAGRLAPRSRMLAPQRPASIFAVALFKLTLVPVFFAYLRAPLAWRSDVAALGLVFLLWMLGGWVNTSANLLAPRLVDPELKGTAAGLMAIAYQTAHFVGLAVAVVVALAMYGDITPHH